MKKRLTDYQKIEIVEKYQTGNYNCAELGREYGVLRTSIRMLLKSRDIPIKSMSDSGRKYSLNKYYFDNIDSERKAYWLGLLYADGTNSESKYVTTLRLQETDIKILQEFNNDIGSNMPIKFIERQTKHPTWQNLYRLDINNKHISKRLAELGVHQNKTFTLLFPNKSQISEPLMRHWLRGLWDGDGSVCIYKNKFKSSYRLHTSVVSTLDVCEKIKEWLQLELDINSNIYIPCKEKINTTRRLNISGNRQISKFWEWLYKDSEIFLERKFNNYQKSKILMNENNAKI